MKKNQIQREPDYWYSQGPGRRPDRVGDLPGAWHQPAHLLSMEEQVLRHGGGLAQKAQRARDIG